MNCERKTGRRSSSYTGSLEARDNLSYDTGANILPLNYVAIDLGAGRILRVLSLINIE